MTMDVGSEADRIVWSGRYSQVVGGLDGWTTSHAALARMLDGTREMVLVDPLSFPWEVLRAPQRDIPLVVLAPSDLDEQTVRLLLGSQLLDRLTPWDRIVTDAQEIVDALAGLPADALKRKAKFNRTADLVVRHLRDSLGDTGSGVRRVELWQMGDGFDAHLQGRLADGWRVSTDRYGGDDRPSPHAVVVRLDTDSSAEVAVKQLRSPLVRLQPGGTMLIVADVVPAAGEPMGIGIRGLLEALQRASGTAHVVQDLRSVQWPGEPMSRGVVIELVSLLGTRDDRETR
jgi:hypothetical protein